MQAQNRDMTLDELTRPQEGDRATALKHVARLARRARELDIEMTATIRLCSSAGASLREIADAAGMSHMTVKRLLERTS